MSQSLNSFVQDVLRASEWHFGALVLIMMVALMLESKDHRMEFPLLLLKQLFPWQTANIQQHGKDNSIG